MLLQNRIQQANANLNELQNRYNELIRQRNQVASEFRQRQINNEIAKVEQDIRQERNTINTTQAALDQLIAAARQLGKEDLLGIMKEEEEIVP